jgi:hypothetical protein
MSVARLVSSGFVVAVVSIVACGGESPTTEESVGEEAAPLSGTVSISAVSSGKCFDVTSSSSANGAKIQQFTCSSAANQRFTLKDAGSGQYQLVSVSSGKCLDVAGVSTANGAALQQWACGSGANQRFAIQSKGNGQYALQAAHSSKCLDVAGVSNANGALIQQWSCGTGTNQRFVLSGLSTGPTGSGGSGGSGSTGTSGSSSIAGASGSGGNSSVAWRKANLTNFESYPDPGSDECINFNGCTWAGMFAGIEGKQTLDWVKAHNILAVHSKDFAKYKLKTLRLKQGSKQIDAVVYDECADSDCSGCCTQNAGSIGFLIDIEKYSMQRFGSGDGVVDWTCLDCN